MEMYRAIKILKINLPRYCSSFIIIASIFCGILIAPKACYAQYSSVRIQVIDRGQADGILIRTPNKKWIVIDAGTNSQQAEAMSQSWGVDTVSLAIISHRHFDHLGGMDEILTAFPVKQFLGSMQNCPGNSSDDKIRDIVNSKAITVHPLEADTLTIDGVDFIILPQPPLHDCPEDENDNSIVVRLEFGEFSMLFPGDAELEELDWLETNHREMLDVDVLKASHHGSNNGMSAAWLNAVTPIHVIISAGVNATYGHPQKEAVEAYEAATGGRLYCTNRNGTIRVYGYADGRIKVQRQRHSDKSCIYDGTAY